MSPIRAFVVGAAVLYFLLEVEAAAIAWTGYGADNQWTNPVNWNPDSVPGPQDDVTITSGNVLVTIATGVNSLVMGDSFEAPANLTLFESFFVGTGGLQVLGNGNLMINAGSASLTGQVTIGGNLFFQSGMIGGEWTINSRGVADLSGAAEKTLSGCSFVSEASSFTLSGVLVLNQSSQLIVKTSVVMSNDVSVQAQDSTPVLLDTSAGTLTYTGNGDLQLQCPVSIGAFNFQAGNLTIFDSLTLESPFVIPSGSYVATVGTATANLTAGVSGAGVLTAAGATMLLGKTTVTGAVSVVGGNLVFTAPGSEIAVLSVAGGQAVVNVGVSATQLNLLNGVLNGSATVTAKNVYLSSPGFNLNAAVSVTGTASLGGLVAFGSSGSLELTAAAVGNAYASVTFTGVAGQTVTNNGLLTAANPVVFQGINLAGSGNVSATSTVSFQTATLQQADVFLSGTGVLKGSNTRIAGIQAITSPALVKGQIGSYSFACPHECVNVQTSTYPTTSFRFTA